MKSRESKPGERSRSRVWIGLVVLAAIALVLGLKFLGPSDEQRTTDEQTTAVDRRAPTEVPPSVTAPAKEQPPTATVTDTPSSPTQDPFPTDPVAQLAWIQRNKAPAMVLFHSTSCVPCKQMEKLVAKIRDDYEPDVYFIDVITNDKANSALVRQAGIQAIPTTFFLSSEGKGKKAVGAIAEDALREQLDLLRQGGL